MIHLFKIIIAFAIAVIWYYLTQNQEISIAFFILMLIVFFIKPIAYQSSTEREEFIEKFRKSKERQINLELMRKEEKKRAQEERDKKKSKEEETQ
ncbi:hypothetical protein [Helicobacter apodemus]|uniref:Uncharacterized protein n=1 Tax=Helicobacter apodemus TaxID=135569 RepID=A0A2U8FD91_9HELI|nr:hypothetical protein [Helicobacter apodemus]AWI33807.1 hypothetical protein CDV25_02790 [Helicobacter apodemus]